MISNFSVIPISWPFGNSLRNGFFAFWCACWGYACFLLRLMRFKKNSFPNRRIPREISLEKPISHSYLRAIRVISVFRVKFTVEFTG